jgi:hypothetical protein
LAAPSPPPPSRRARWIAAGLALAILLPIAAFAAVALLLPSEVIARVASQRAEAALGAPVSIADVEIDLWPVPSVALTGARLGAEDDPIARADRILLRPRILPLFSGNVTVREIAIERPDIRLVVDSSGALNLPFASSSSDEPGSRASVEFAVEEFRVRGGRLSYVDTRDGTDIRILGLEQSLQIAGRLADGTLAVVGLDGSLSSDSVDAELPARLAAPLRGLRFAVRHDAQLDREADRLDLRELRIEVQRVALEGSGRIESLSDSLGRSVSLELRTDEFSFEDLARSLPDGFLSGLLAGRSGDSTSTSSAGGRAEEEVDLDYAGRATIAARVDGRLTRDSIPRVTGEVRFSEVAVGLRGSPLLAATAGAIAFSNQTVESQDVTGNLLGEAFAIAFRIDSLAAPVAAFTARGTARVEELLAAAGEENSTSASGSVPFDLRGRLRPGNPAASVVEGTIGIEGVRLVPPSLLQPVQVEAGLLRFAGTRVNVEGLAVAFGESRVRANAEIDGWLTAVLGDSTGLPMVRFDATAGTLDLDALLGPSESEYSPLLFARLTDRPVNGKSAAEAASELGMKLPDLPRARATGMLRAERLVRNGMIYQDVEVQFESSPEAVSAPRARFGMMGGTVELGLALQRGVSDATLVMVYHLENVGAGSFFSRFTPFEGHLSGLLALDGEASLQLDEHMLPVRPTVQSSGTAALISGSLANWPLLRAVGERLGIASFDTLGFREWSGSFQIAGPLVSLERSLQVADRVETELAGSFDFGGKLDLGVVARLSPELVARAGEPIRAAALAAAGGSGGVPVGLRITGTTTAPSVTLDLSAARDNAIAQARAKAVGEAEAAARSAASEVARRALGDTVPIAPDSLADALRSRVQDRVRGLFGRQPRSAPPPPVAQDSAPIPAGVDSAGADSVGAPDSTDAGIM